MLPLLLQIPVTLAIIAWVPGNLSKLAALLALWVVTFRRLQPSELVLFFGINLFFTLMNAMSLRQGIFAFSTPDVLGMPAYEFFMWGFYLLHLKRLLDGSAPAGHRTVIWSLALLYAFAFATVSDANMLLAVSGILLAIGLVLFHEPLDLAYTGYLIALGAGVEYTGVHSGQWHYPGTPPGGVPLWFITLWGGVGFFMRRLVLPLLPSQPTGVKP